MEFEVPNKFLSELVNNFDKYNEKYKIEKTKEISEFFNKIKSDYLISWRKSDSIFELKEEFFPQTEFLNILLDIALDPILSVGVQGGWKFSNHLKNYFLVLKDPKGAKITDLKVLESALKEFIKDSPHKYLFKPSLEGVGLLPYYVEKIKHITRQTHYQTVSPENVIMTLHYNSFNESHSNTYTFYAHHIKGGKTVFELLKSANLFLESKELYSIYQEELVLFKKYSDLVGDQFLGTGKSYMSGDSWWNREQSTYLDVEGKPSKLIMDEFENEKKIKNLETQFWTKEIEYVMPPFHPYVRCFNLENHSFVKTHINNIISYIYNPKLGDKLILPKAHKNLISILTQSAANLLGDIIQGKTGGIITLCTGKPGTGKTLTAEIYSEVIQRPLYVVQSSQLGINIEQLEKNLKVILNRAAKWKVILLIDEADVYIHERGDDLIQNAIVGVFLRLLEYYKGILFLLQIEVI